MINLEPIAKSVQKRMFEKMRALGKETSYSDSPTGVLTQQEMMSRTTFIRMMSDQSRPVILMGGELKEDGGLRAGYDEIYGPRLSINEELEQSVLQGSETNSQNPNKRPMPGIKSIDVSFKGGARAVREATVSWTCWSFDDINRLTPHFLAHGKTVLLEWGWVYNKKSLQNIPSFVDAITGRISESAFEDKYVNSIIQSGGDFDMMIGIVKNFEYTTRSDGAFDCQTILSSVGVNLLKNPLVNETTSVSSATFTLDENEEKLKLISKLKNASKDTAYGPGLSGDSVGAQEEEKLLDLDTDVTFKLLIANINNYIITEIEKLDKKSQNQIKLKKSVASYYYYQPNKYVINTRAANLKADLTDIKNHSFVDNCWVRWGWFEDNILSKFTALTSKKGKILGELRSIESVLTVDGEQTDIYESTKIKNSKYLETIDINAYILPGKFTPQKNNEKIKAGEETLTLKGDNINLVQLAEIVNNVDNFDGFNAPKESVELEFLTKNNVEIMSTAKDPEEADKIFSDFSYAKKLGLTEKVTEDRLKYGYLRNMLINTNVIKEAFGVTENFTIESLTIEEGLNNMFEILNRPINFWSLTIEADTINSDRQKIVDNNTTKLDFEKSIDSQKSIYQNDELLKKGVFYFPVWRHDSIVKSQNVSAKVPDALQLTAMYGANIDQLKDFSTPGSQFSEKGGVIAGGLVSGDKDKTKDGLDLAFRNISTLNIGTKSSSAKDKLNIKDGDDVVSYLKLRTEELKKGYAGKLEKLEEDLTAYEKSVLNKEWEKSFDSSAPPPSLTYLSESEKTTLLKVSISRKGKEELEQIYGSKYNADGVLKLDFQNSISRLTTGYGLTRDSSIPIIVPLELELEVDGTGGIYPGNSFHSTYLPQNYQEKTVFQIFDVNHNVSSNGWFTTISGKMRSTLNSVFRNSKTLSQIEKELFDAYETKLQAIELKRKQEASQFRLNTKKAAEKTNKKLPKFKSL